MSGLRRDPIVPVLDTDVRQCLRYAQEPIQLCGETGAQRRQRLRALMVEQMWLDMSSLKRACGAAANERASAPAALGATDKYTRGPLFLAGFRGALHQSSVQRAAARVAELKFDAVTLQQLGNPKVRDVVMTPILQTHVVPLSRHVAALNVRMEQHQPPPAAEGEGAHEELEAPITATLRTAFTSLAALVNVPSRLATGDAVGVVTVWDTLTGAPLASSKSHTNGYGRVQSIACHKRTDAATSVLFSCARQSQCVAVWVHREGADDEGSASSSAHRLEKVESLASDAIPHHGTFSRLASDPTGTMLAATSSDCVVRLWDVQRSDAGASAVFLHGLDGYVESRTTLDVDFHPDGSLLSVTDGAGRCSTWDLRCGSMIFSTWFEPHVRGPCTAVRWAPCGTRFATGGADQCVMLWDARRLHAAVSASGVTECTKLASPRRMPGHLDYVTTLSFVPAHSGFGGLSQRTCGGAVLCSSGLDGRMLFWDLLHSGTILHTIQSSFEEGAVRGHTWVRRLNEGGVPCHDLVAITAAHHWSSWSVAVPAGGGVVVPVESHKYVVRAATACATLPAACGDRAADTADASGSSSDDEMSALRRKPAAAAAGTLGIAAVPKAVNEDEDDDMAALRRK